MVTLIFMEQGKFVECEVQGRASDSSEFKFDPTGWHKPTYSTLTSASCKFALNEYNTIEELMKGDFMQILTSMIHMTGIHGPLIQSNSANR